MCQGKAAVAAIVITTRKIRYISRKKGQTRAEGYGAVQLQGTITPFAPELGPGFSLDRLTLLSQSAAHDLTLSRLSANFILIRCLPMIHYCRCHVKADVV